MLVNPVPWRWLTAVLARYGNSGCDSTKDLAHLSEKFCNSAHRGHRQSAHGVALSTCNFPLSGVTASFVTEESASRLRRPRFFMLIAQPPLCELLMWATFEMYAIYVIRFPLLVLGTMYVLKHLATDSLHISFW